MEDSERAVRITSHADLEEQKLTKLSHYRFVVRTDISRFYHSIYTHSIPWAVHGKRESKEDTNPNSVNLHFNKLDKILRSGQDNQTIGIPVGPDFSRVVAEIIATAIDLRFRDRIGLSNYAVVRHVDDIWIGTNSHADAEQALGRYREAMREFELDINENKTAIFSNDFKFGDIWPNSILQNLDFASQASKRKIAERLRAALEHAFNLASSSRDDAIIKFVIRQIDLAKLYRENWTTLEPFLKRAAVHFGHTIEYVAQILIWRHFSSGNLDIKSWTEILSAILTAHGRLGNDSEVCWALYLCAQLNPDFPDVSTN